ncbi:MAG: asparagine synthase (glutamine-hydrolyzing) [Proteobacteria bacterium]|nr:asparagine synthase (glutamine-hydrolyzing) [Pseudomonadota bacterium]NOG59115.1 asparagine synthase (glutamine-hydrolyzing) [Pseudomonadota bacterium]
MCGISGLLTKTPGVIDISKSSEAMISTLAHRGPDDEGIWNDNTVGVSLAHRRLSILDLSPEGHQPMSSVNGRYIMVFNGEIYNYEKLRKELESTSSLQENICPDLKWRGHSDTEVMLAAIVKWGVEGAVKRFIGMFAFALWDREEKKLYLVRDRIGEKPLYYGWVGDVFLFGSELKALRAYPKWHSDIDRSVLARYLQFNYVPSPYSIYKGIKKLEPGCIAEISSDAVNNEINIRRYWSMDVGLGQSLQSIDDKTAIDNLEVLLSESVKRQMAADVPLGAFLSGGIDSSLIVALMQKQSLQPIKTFTIGFNEASFNEAEHALSVAKHLGTEHTELYVSPQDAMDVIPLLPALYDEPFADSSQIPTYLVSRMTRKHVTVSLSGDGGDEFFGGYNRYTWGQNIWDRIKLLPLPLRRAFASTLRAPSPHTWDKLFSIFKYMLPARYRYSSAGDKLHKLAKLLGAVSPNDIFIELISLWEEKSIVLGSEMKASTVTDQSQWSENLGFTEFMMYMDAKTYLPDDIMVKVDRAAMGVSLESRAPFLDHKVIEYACSLPLNLKIRNGQGKWLLRQILYKYVPQNLIERPKMGFGVPIDSWLRGPLRNWAEELLDENRMRSASYLNTTMVRNKWEEHLSGKRNWQYHLWGVLMFQSWLNVQNEI